jgi:hypothetical protein
MHDPGHEAGPNPAYVFGHSYRELDLKPIQTTDLGNGHRARRQDRSFPPGRKRRGSLLARDGDTR